MLRFRLINRSSYLLAAINTEYNNCYLINESTKISLQLIQNISKNSRKYYSINSNLTHSNKKLDQFEVSEVNDSARYAIELLEKIGISNLNRLEFEKFLKSNFSNQIYKKL